MPSHLLFLFFSVSSQMAVVLVDAFFCFGLFFFSSAPPVITSTSLAPPKKKKKKKKKEGKKKKGKRNFLFKFITG